MSRFAGLCAAVLAMAGSVSIAHAGPPDSTLAVVMTNAPSGNEIRVYDAASHALVQSLPTNGKGGVSGNARGVRSLDGELLAVVNNGSNTVSVFRRAGDRLRLDKLVTTSSAPVSIDFGNDHMYVAGATTVDSFVIHGNTVGWLDGTALLELATGGAPPNGSTAQVGVLDDRTLLVTLKADPDPGTVDVLRLRDGAIDGAVPTAVSAPAGTLTPFGFAALGDGTAVITLAHSDQVGLFRNDAFRAVIPVGQGAPCWMTRTGKYLFTANTGSRSISRFVSTGSQVFVDAVVAANITAGGSPSDLDADAGVMAVLDRGAGQSHLTFFSYNRFGELTPSSQPVTIGVPGANGVAIMAAPDRDDR